MSKTRNGVIIPSIRPGISPYLIGGLKLKYFAEPIYTGLTRAWSLGESTIRKELKGSGDDFYPTGVTSENGFTKFNGVDQYICCGDSGFGLGDDTSFTIQIILKPTGTSGTRFIATKGFITMYGMCEWYLYHSGTQVYFRIANALGEVTVTDSAHRLAAGKETSLIFGYDSVNQIISIKVDDFNPVTLAYTGKTINSKAGIIIGTDASRYVGNYYNGAAKNLLYYTGRYLDSVNQSVLFNTPFPSVTLVSESLTLDLDSVANKYSNHDFSDITTQFKDSTKTTPALTDGDKIKVIESKWNMHDWIASSDAIAPIVKTNILNGLNCGFWNGVDSNLDFDQRFPGNADFTFFLIVKNLRNSSAKGSQIVTNSIGLSYISLTGVDYSNGNYAVAHTDNGDAVAGNKPLLNPSGFSLIEFVRKGNVYKISENGRVHYVDNYGIKTIASDFVPNRMGAEYGVGWWFNGYTAQSVVYTSALNDITRARIRRTLADKWAIPNILYLHA